MPNKRNLMLLVACLLCVAIASRSLLNDADVLVEPGHSTSNNDSQSQFVDSYPADPGEAGSPAPKGGTSAATSTPVADSGWGELVRFKFDTEGCDTESIGENKQIPCVPRVVADHPYDLFTDDQLRQIANTDGIAALILGARLGYRRANVEEYKESLETLTAAVALTGHVDALKMLMTQYGVTSATQYTNGELDVGKASASYVWHKTGFDLGLVSETVLERVSKPLRDRGDIDFAALDAAANQRTQWFKARRLELTGETFS